MQPLRNSMGLATLAVLVALGISACAGDEVPTTTPTATAATAAGAPSAGGSSPSTPTTPGITGEPFASTASIPTSELPLVRFVPRTGAPVELPVEVLPREEFAIGFSGRYEIEGRGMLFYYPELSGGGFWMRNTHVDLDIAFIDADRQVIFITTMLADTLDVHRPGAPYLAAIETPAGWYAEHGIGVGARVEFLFDPLTQPAP